MRRPTALLTGFDPYGGGTRTPRLGRAGAPRVVALLEGLERRGRLAVPLLEVPVEGLERLGAGQAAQHGAEDLPRLELVGHLAAGRQVGLPLLEEVELAGDLGVA